jgi:alkylation response protein AidB-like acyl-CoA dehydrogenase
MDRRSPRPARRRRRQPRRTGAHIADYGEILCRTNPDAPKHRGITAFILDLRTPGVTIRPLKQMTGTAEFNEIFLHDVRVPHANVIGQVDDGWHVAVTTLMNERKTIGAGGASKRSNVPGEPRDDDTIPWRDIQRSTR